MIFALSMSFFCSKLGLDAIQVAILNEIIMILESWFSLYWNEFHSMKYVVKRPFITMNEAVEAEIEQLITLQHYFMNLSDSTLQETLKFLAASKFVRNPEDFKEFLDSFLIFIEIRPLLIPNLIIIAKVLIDMFPIVKTQFLHYFFLIYFTCPFDDFDCYMLHVLYRLMELGAYSKEEIMDEFKKYYKISYNKRYNPESYFNIVEHFFCFFAPEMLEVEEHFFNRVLFNL